MNIFRKLRWKLTLNYTIVTVSAFLVVILILGGIVFPRIFLPINFGSPEIIVDSLMENTSPVLSRILSESPVDQQLLYLLFRDPNSTITSADFLRIGSIQLSVSTIAMLRALVIGSDGILIGKTNPGLFLPNLLVGQPFDPTQFKGLQAPYKAAMAGDTDSSHLYTVLEPDEQFLFTLPLFDDTKGISNRVVGVAVIWMDRFPTQADVPLQILNIAGRVFLVLLFAIGIMGALFGAFFAHGLSARFKRLSTTIEAWSEGDFSEFIVDTTGDEISQLAQQLNKMASQLQDLLHRRQDLAVSEERNRLARDLHDSAKQQALAASFQLGTALTLFDRDPHTAKKHLEEADTLVDSVRDELTDLVHELRPLALDGQDFSELLKDYVMDWSQRNKIESKVNIEGIDETSLDTREALFRITQEALANVARHSAASLVEISLMFDPNIVTMAVKDNGCGFDILTVHPGFGLSSMRERTERQGGNFIVESEPDRGTRIIVTFPYLNREA
jgi:two-component system, NarL family, sensor histidine kinase LiaS